MTITMLCPGCDGKLSAPATAAGKKVKCPKCQALMLVPGHDVPSDFEVMEDDFEVVEDKPLRARPKKPVIDEEDRPRIAAKKRVMDDDDNDRPRRRDDNDDFDDDFDEPRPRRKKLKKKKSGSGSKVLLIGGGAALLLIVAVCGGIWMIARSFGPKNTDPSKTNWVAFAAPDNSFTTSFPGGSPNSGNLFDMLNEYNDAKISKMKAEMATNHIDTPAWQVKDGSRRYLVGYLQVPAAAAMFVRPEELMRGVVNEWKPGSTVDGEKIITSVPGTFAGQPSHHVVIETKSPISNNRQAITVFAVKGGRMYFLLAEGSGITHEDAMAKAFFEKFALSETAKPAASASPPNSAAPPPLVATPPPADTPAQPSTPPNKAKGARPKR